MGYSSYQAQRRETWAQVAELDASGGATTSQRLQIAVLFGSQMSGEKNDDEKIINFRGLLIDHVFSNTFLKRIFAQKRTGGLGGPLALVAGRSEVLPIWRWHVEIVKTQPAGSIHADFR